MFDTIVENQPKLKSLNTFIMAEVKILGIAGSIRKDSFNRSLLREAQNLVPDNAEMEIFELDADIPGFNQDEEQNPPQKIKDFKQKIREADAILFVTPEYNYSIPGILKNAIDWASRPYGDNAFDGKAAAIMGASISNIATARAQYHLRQTFVFLNLHAVNQPEVMVNANESFDDSGNLTNGTTKELMQKQLQALVELAKKVRK